MRLARFILSYILLSIFALLVSIFLAQNIRLEHLAFFGLDFTFNFVWLLLGAAAFGFLLTLFLFLPSRIALSLHSRRLEREAEQLAQHVAWLQEQREDLLARHEDLLTDHQHLLHQHRRLLADYGAAVAERDQVRTQLASLDTIRLPPRRQYMWNPCLRRRRRLTHPLRPPCQPHCNQQRRVNRYPPTRIPRAST